MKERVLRLPVNEWWYGMIKDGKIDFDYREIKPYWTARLENREYDVVEFYHRFKKDIPVMRYKFEKVIIGKIGIYPDDYYIILFSKFDN